jgi:universal stress protein F
MPDDIKTILCPINLRHATVSSRAYDRAVELARLHGAKLVVVTVAPEIERNLNIYDSRAYWGDKLAEFVAANPPDGVEVSTEVLIGAVHRRIVKAAEALSADLVVMEAANPRVQDYLLGTTASHVVTHAECSVYVVR